MYLNRSCQERQEGREGTVKISHISTDNYELYPISSGRRFCKGKYNQDWGSLSHVQPKELDGPADTRRHL